MTGSFKFDVARRNEAKEKELREWILESDRVGAGSDSVGASAKDSNPTLNIPKILLGGSTWPGEDEVLLGIYKRLIEQSNNSRDCAKTLREGRRNRGKYPQVRLRLCQAKP